MCPAEVQLGERVRASEVVLGEGVGRETVGEEPARERRPDDDAETAVERVREQILLVRSRERRILELEYCDRPDGQRALHELRRMIGEAAVANLPLGNELLKRAPRLLDG